MLDELILMKPSYYAKREARRNQISADDSFISKIDKMQADDLDAQYRRVFSQEGRMAVIKILGPLTPDGPDWIDILLGYQGTAYKNIIRAAEEAKKMHDSGLIDEVIIRMNTPGGTVGGVDHAYQALLKIRDFATVKNDGLIASGGVWLASALKRIEPSTDSAVIGSIGVVAALADFTGYYDMWGVQVFEITNTESPNKRPDVLTEEGRAIIRKELDDLYQVFVSKVTAGRPVTKDDIDSLKGEVLIASKAITFGLMDMPKNGYGQGPAQLNNSNETEVNMEVQKVKTEEVVQVAADLPNVEALVQDAVKIERARIYGLLAISGVAVNDDLKMAINDGISTGDYAVAQAEVKNKAAAAEIEAAKELRKQNHDDIGAVRSDQAEMGKDDDAVKTVHAVVDKSIARMKGGKK